MDKEQFVKHMQDKADYWKTYDVVIGEDFAVFDFNYKYQAKDAWKNLEHYATYYGYNCAYSGNDKIVIINTMI